MNAAIPSHGGEPARPVEIVADDRERDSGIAERLAELPGLQVTRRRLALGDYLVAGRVVIERKTLADLALSIADGRLFRQAIRMTRSIYRPLLLIEGRPAEPGMPGVSRAAIQGAILSLAMFLNIPCLRSLDASESAALIRFAANQLGRRMGRGVARHGWRPAGRRARRLFVLQGLPGIGPARADRLLETFGSIARVAQADAAALAAVPGIGDKTAAAIRNLLGPDPDPGTAAPDATP